MYLVAGNHVHGLRPCYLNPVFGKMYILTGEHVHVQAKLPRVSENALALLKALYCDFPFPGAIRITIHRLSMGTTFRSRGPVYSVSGRISRLLATCSRTFADHPTLRLAAKVAVKRSGGKPTESITTAE